MGKIIPFNYTSPIPVNGKLLYTNEALSYPHVNLITLPFFHRYTVREIKYFLENTDQKTSDLQLMAQKDIFQACIKTIYPKAIKNNVLVNFKKIPAFEMDDTLKIKISPMNLSAIQFINSIDYHTFRGKLRLDGNRQFSIKTLLFFLDNLNCPINIIEYIEEPFAEYHEHVLFKQFSSIPLALDESLLAFKNNILNFKNLKPQALIIKPSLWGLTLTEKIIATWGQQIPVVISSTFEDEKVLHLFSNLASLSPTVHGLNTAGYLPKILNDAII